MILVKQLSKRFQFNNFLFLSRFIKLRSALQIKPAVIYFKRGYIYSGMRN